MKLTDKISWLMGRVQKSFFPHLNQCFKAPLTAQEKHLVSILEVLQVEHSVPRVVTNYRWPEHSWPRLCIAIRRPVI